MEGKRKSGYPASALRHGSHRSTVNLYLTLGAAALAAIGSLLSVNVFFNLSPTGLSINGTTLYAPEQIQVVGGLSPGQNLIRLNTDFVEQRLKENLVYVDEVEVIKDYPESLIINIKEAKPKAQIEYEGGYCTVSSSGRLLEIGESERNKKLPLISGFELVGPADEAAMSDASSQEDGEIQPMIYKPVSAGIEAMSADDQKSVIIKQLFDELDRLGFKKIARIDLNDRTDIKLVYDGRIVIELGSSVDLDIKLGYIQAVLEKLPESYEGILRYNGIERGISAIPKKTEVQQQAASTSANPLESSSAPDQSGEQQWGGQQWNDWGYTDTPDYGYSDYGYGYDDYGYTDYGW